MMMALISAAVLLGGTASPAEESSLSDELFELWEGANQNASDTNTDFSTLADYQWQQREEVLEDAEQSGSLTPHLDRLLGVSDGRAAAAPATAPDAVPRSLGHEAFFDNPLTTQMNSDGTYGPSKSGASGRTYSHRRHRRSGDHSRPRHCGHTGGCSCNTPPNPNPEPVPEPGTLLLAGIASAAAIRARRRAQRKNTAATEISD